MEPRCRLQAVLVLDPARLGEELPGEWVTAQVELPADLTAQDVDPSTLLLNHSVAAERAAVSVGDDDGDGIPDLTVNFRRKDVRRLLHSAAAQDFVVSGKLKNGLMFEARTPPKAAGR